MRMRGKYFWIFLFLPLLCWSGEKKLTEEWKKLSPREKKELESGKVIYKSVKYTAPEGKIKGYGESIAIINAPIEKCWEIFTKFDQQQEYFPRKTASIILKQKPGFALVLKRFKFFGFTVEYAIKYQIDPQNYRIDFELDPSQPHDIKDTAGFFLFEKLSGQKTLFIYGVTRLDTGIKVPSFIQKYLQKKDLPEVADNVRKRIESGGTWRKK